MRQALGEVKKVFSKEFYPTPLNVAYEMAAPYLKDSGVHVVLDPTWCEWFMRFPLGHTSLEPMDPKEFERWKNTSPEEWWSEEPKGVPRFTYERSRRIDRVRALGNAQVPDVAKAAWEALR